MERGKKARWVLRGVALAGAAVCAWPGWGPVWMKGLVPGLSPFNALLTVAAGAGGLFLLGAAAAGAVCAFWPRAFCRWLCPAGTCQNAAAGCRRLVAPHAPALGMKHTPRLGIWLVLVGTGAALAGFPLFGWLDPLVMFNAFFGVAGWRPEWRDWLAAVGLPLLILIAFVAPGWWCGRICPLGALQDLLRMPFRARGKGAAGRGGTAVGRRAFLGLGLGAGYRIAISPLRPGSAQLPIRPPGAAEESRFIRLCTRCGACVRSCPPGIIRFGGDGTCWAGVLSPEVSFENRYCEPSCTRCGQVCPSGAIARFTRGTKFARPMGTAVVDMDICFLGQNRECGVCVNICEYGALDLKWDPEEMASRLTLDPSLCTGCGNCVYICPSTPKAIRIQKRRDLWRAMRGLDGLTT